jgi:hypothetical protein
LLFSPDGYYFIAAGTEFANGSNPVRAFRCTVFASFECHKFDLGAIILDIALVPVHNKVIFLDKHAGTQGKRAIFDIASAPDGTTRKLTRNLEFDMEVNEEAIGVNYLGDDQILIGISNSIVKRLDGGLTS